MSGKQFRIVVDARLQADGVVDALGVVALHFLEAHLGIEAPRRLIGALRVDAVEPGQDGAIVERPVLVEAAGDREQVDALLAYLAAIAPPGTEIDRSGAAAAAIRMIDEQLNARKQAQERASREIARSLSASIPGASRT